ncbi:CocE/NonD family hydrolase [Trichothermofontia sp.]
MLLVQKITDCLITRDGVRLDADIYRPTIAGLFPVLLMRQPYGRAIASTVVYAHPSWYAAHGYIVVIQDVRGRGTSTGQFDLFAHEVEDGLETVNWAAQLPGSTGAVGMYGFSYQGMTQLYAAAARPPALKVICPAMVGYDLYADWAYEEGAFCLQANLSWAIQLAAETARRQGDANTYQQLYAAARDLPLFDPIPANPNLLKNLAPDSFYHDWLRHEQPGDYWRSRSPDLSGVDLPMLHIGGWFDPYLRGSLRLYHAMADRSAFPQHLIIGPWAHLPWSRQVGAIDFGPEAASPVDALQLRWFDHFLKGQNQGIETEPPVRWFEMGSHQWRSFPAWPQGQTQVFRLTSNGLASIREDAGQLIAAPIPETVELPAAQDVLVHDPWRPVPALGGHAAIPAGPFERRAIDSRSDVLTYTSAPLTQALHLAGDLWVDLWCEADRPSFDLCAILSDVYPDGRVYNLSQGYRRVVAMQSSQPYRIQLQPTCARIPPGHALRLSLSAACFPAYALNLGTGGALATGQLIEAQMTTIVVKMGGNSPTGLWVTLVEGKDEEKAHVGA